MSGGGTHTRSRRPATFLRAPTEVVAGCCRPLLRWAYRRSTLFPIAADIGLWGLGTAIGPLLHPIGATGWTVADDARWVAIAAPIAMVVHGALGRWIGLYRHRWRTASFDELTAFGMVWAVAALAQLVAMTVLVPVANGPAAVVTGAMATVTMVGGLRAVTRRFWEQAHRPDRDRCRRTIVFGAGEGGTQIVRAMVVDPASNYYPVALLDDDPYKANREIEGVRVRGTRRDLASVAEALSADLLVVAVPSAGSSLIGEMNDLAGDAGLELRVVPAGAALLDQVSLADVRPPTVDDLLGRDPVDIDLGSVSAYLRGRRVLITGAGGSIGSELSRQVRGFGPSELYLLDRDESALHGLQLSMEGRALLTGDMLVVADIRDRERIFELFDRFRPEVVFHTAALKHLTLLENHPSEAIKTNTCGTKNLLDAAVAVDVERFVNISTDKAADPTSVLGATKLAAERLTARAGRTTGRPFVSVRFGNVLGSRGSVLPTFLGQIEQGKPLTVTHPDVTRYFMTVAEAVRLVVQAGAIGDPGEVMILDMGRPVRIVDLAEQLMRSMGADTGIEYTGLRPGEKMHEALIGVDEVGRARQHPRITHTRGSEADPAEALLTVGEDAVAATRVLLARLDAVERPPLRIGAGITVR